MNHTPGPWTHSDFSLSESHEDEVSIFDGRVNETLAQVMPIGHRDERNANVLLMVAAPDMFKALQAADEELCRATFPGPRDQKGLNYAIDKVRKALAKATGGKR